MVRFDNLKRFKYGHFKAYLPWGGLYFVWLNKCIYLKIYGDVWCMKGGKEPEINEFFTSISSHVVMISHEYILLDNGNIYTNN